jgi:predicted metal-dependent enzyme (double-stranded beta helix superfamily)
MVSIRDFSERLAAISEKDFTHASVLDFLRKNRVDPASLSPYLFFSSEHYTRNLIHRTELFELIAICWESGHKSAIHNHRDQCCWMAMAHGKVQVHNFKLVRKDPSTGFCELKSSTQFTIAPDSPQEVDPEEPIHQVLNLPSFRSRAVTLHVYSRPYDTCEVYDLKTKHYEVVRLTNTTEFGVLKTDMPVERVSL